MSLSMGVGLPRPPRYRVDNPCTSTSGMVYRIVLEISRQVDRGTMFMSNYCSKSLTLPLTFLFSSGAAFLGATETVVGVF